VRQQPVNQVLHLRHPQRQLQRVVNRVLVRATLRRPQRQPQPQRQQRLRVHQQRPDYFIHYA
jgi:hypothetical protein